MVLPLSDIHHTQIDIKLTRSGLVGTGSSRLDTRTLRLSASEIGCCFTGGKKALASLICRRIKGGLVLVISFRVAEGADLDLYVPFPLGL